MKKAAIIGMGVISSIHLAAIESNPGITLAAACLITCMCLLPRKRPGWEFMYSAKSPWR